MYFRNKGTAIKPKWQVVESRRIEIDGKKTSRQKVICTLGDIKNPSDLIKRWKLILDNARTAQRRHWDIKFRNKKFPLVRRYARRMSFDEIKSRHDKIVMAVERLKWQHEGINFKKQLKIKMKLGFDGDSNKAMEFSMKLTALLATITDVLARDNLKNWSMEHKWRMRERLDYVINFYHRL